MKTFILISIFILASLKSSFADYTPVLSCNQGALVVDMITMPYRGMERYPFGYQLVLRDSRVVHFFKDRFKSSFDLYMKGSEWISDTGRTDIRSKNYDLLPDGSFMSKIHFTGESGDEEGVMEVMTESPTSVRLKGYRLYYSGTRKILELVGDWFFDDCSHQP